MPVQPAIRKIKTDREPQTGPSTRPASMAIMSCITIGTPAPKGICIKQPAQIKAAKSAAKINFLLKELFIMTKSIIL